MSGFSQRQTVRVTPGQVFTIRLAWPTGRLAINAVPWAEAFVDGRSVGETPIGNVQVPIGPHQIVLRHPQLGERSLLCDGHHWRDGQGWDRFESEVYHAASLPAARVLKDEEPGPHAIRRICQTTMIDVDVIDLNDDRLLLVDRV